MGSKERSNIILSKEHIRKRLISDRRFRMVTAAAFSLMGNLLFALYNGILGLLSISLWFAFMCVYYVILSVMRFSVVMCEYKNSLSQSYESINEKESAVMKRSGVLLALMSLLLTGILYISLSKNIVARHSEVVMITIAAYVFYKITMSVIRAVKQRRDNSLLLSVIRSIGYADAAASVLTLERSMIATFGSVDEAVYIIMNGISGAVVCVFIFLTGIRLIKNSLKEESRDRCIQEVC